MRTRVSDRVSSGREGPTLTETDRRYDTGVVSGALVLLDDDLQLSSWQKECVVSSAVLLAAVGAALGAIANERWGRKSTITLASALFAVGAVVVGVASSYDVRAPRPRSNRRGVAPTLTLSLGRMCDCRYF